MLPWPAYGRDVFQMSKLAIIIVNYRTAALTVDCLRSIVADGCLPGRGRVIVVDNASGDGSVEVIGQAIAANRWSEWVELIPAERNGGFAYGNNVGIRAAFATSGLPVPASRSPQSAIRNPISDISDYVLLLNPDTVVRPAAIEALAGFMEEHPEAGICGGRLLDAQGRPQCSGFRFPSILGELENGCRMGVLTRLLSSYVTSRPLCETPTAVDWVSGAALMIRREVIEQIGLLDERYFMYYEEVDYCRRAKVADWEVWHVPQAEIVHLEGAASGVNEPRKPRPTYWYDSRRRYYSKHHGRLYAAAAELAFQAGYLTWRLRRPVQGKPDTDPRGRMRDGWRFVALPSLLGT